jgi:transcriptional regulator NrdR family protein
MNCPRCGAPSSVLHTRVHPASVARRRECFNLHRFTTHEVVPTVIDQRQMARTKRGFLQRAAAWARRQVVLRSKEPANVLARRLGITAERVRQIRAEG